MTFYHYWHGVKSFMKTKLLGFDFCCFTENFALVYSLIECSKPLGTKLGVLTSYLSGKHVELKIGMQ